IAGIAVVADAACLYENLWRRRATRDRFAEGAHGVDPRAGYFATIFFSMPAVDVLAGEIDDCFCSLERARPFADMLAVPLEVRRIATEDERLVTLRSQSRNECASDKATAPGENDAFHSGCRLRAAQP